MSLQSELCQVCESDDISVDTLREKIQELCYSSGCEDNTRSSPLGILRHKIKHLNPCDSKALRELNVHPFFHKACLNKNVTLEVVRYLLDEFPGIEKVMWCYHGDEIYFHEDVSAGHPLHLCCYNQYCPTSVIELMIKIYPSALSHYSSIQFVDNFDIDYSEYYKICPLMYYLTRTSNLDIDVVKMLVQACPQTLLATDDYGDYVGFTALHAILNNPNVGNLQHALTYLLETEPLLIRTISRMDRSPLMTACNNKNITLEVFELLYHQWPEAIRLVVSEDYQNLPIHELCSNDRMNDTASVDILRFMISIDPTLVRERCGFGYLPIHSAARGKSIGFCKTLIDIHPESLREGSMTTWGGNSQNLPIHVCCSGCAYGDKDTGVLQYLLTLDPESINARNAEGWLPFHSAIRTGAVQAVDLLLEHDPDAAMKTSGIPYHPRYPQQLPLHTACNSLNNQLLTVQSIFDAYPEAILKKDGQDRTPYDIAWESNDRHSDVVDFILTQQAYARQAQDIKNYDENDWLSLCCALKDNAPLGSIKLLLRALRLVGHVEYLPLDVACEFSSAKVVQYLVEELGREYAHTRGGKFEYLNKYVYKESVIHHACRGGNLEVVKYLLESHVSLVASAG